MWGWIQPQLAASTRVCAYDRAGFGWSEDGPQPRDVQQIVNELHLLLQNAGVQPPYLLAGHSLGGELMRLYAGEHPDQVVGLVLIDSSHPEQMARMPEIQKESAQGRLLTQAGALTAPFGLMRLYWSDGGPNPDLPAQESGAMRSLLCNRSPLPNHAGRGSSTPAIRQPGCSGRYARSAALDRLEPGYQRGMDGFTGRAVRALFPKRVARGGRRQPHRSTHRPGIRLADRRSHPSTG